MSRAAVPLSVYTRLPPEFLRLNARDIKTLLPTPSLVHIPGARWPPLFVSILVHGNETTGLTAIQRVLAGYAGGRELPRALSLFIGNVEAAARDKRKLAGQPDYNRVWPGQEEGGDEGESGKACAEARMAAEVCETMRARGVFAAVDIHNNTGDNPPYACVNALEPAFLQLARRFSRTVLYFTRPPGTQSMAFARFAPAVTLECGQPGSQPGLDQAVAFVEACLRLDNIPAEPPAPAEIDCFQTAAIVRVPAALALSSEQAGASIHLREDLDRFNWQRVPRNTVLARLEQVTGLGLDVTDLTGRAVTGDYFYRAADELRTARTIVPAMLTCDPRAIRHDCLCYLLEPVVGPTL